MQICQQVDGACYDLGYDAQTVQSMSKVSNFPSIATKILKAVELKAHLDNAKTIIHPSQTHKNVDDVKTCTSINSEDGELKPKIFD